mgnify:CR=1 FL=1
MTRSFYFIEKAVKIPDNSGQWLITVTNGNVNNGYQQLTTVKIGCFFQVTDINNY